MWTKEVPAKIGWYWMKFKRQRTLRICPAFVDRFTYQGKEVYVVDPAYGPRFAAHTRKYAHMTNAQFGRRISEPKP